MFFYFYRLCIIFFFSVFFVCVASDFLGCDLMSALFSPLLSSSPKMAFILLGKLWFIFFNSSSIWRDSFTFIGHCFYLCVLCMLLSYLGNGNERFSRTLAIHHSHSMSGINVYIRRWPPRGLMNVFIYKIWICDSEVKWGGEVNESHFAIINLRM